VAKEGLRRLTKEEISQRIREGVKVIIEQVLEEMTERLAAGYRERMPTRRCERNGHYIRGLITLVGKVEQLRVPREIHCGFAVSEREPSSRRSSSATSDPGRRRSFFGGGSGRAVLEMYLQGSPPARSQPSRRGFLGFASAMARFPG